MAATLVTLIQAKAQLRIDTPALDPGDVEIQLKLDQAEAIILDYVTTPVPAWDATTVPGSVSAAILLMLTHLYEKRGDDPDTDAALWEAIERVLRRQQTPAVA